MRTASLGKWIVIIGIGIAVVGVILWGMEKLGISLGKLPGDIQVHKEKVSIYAPIMTSLIISVVLTILINLFMWLFRR
jgi:heme/copper-type cytochrome/quinol oxidase subunit 2